MATYVLVHGSFQGGWIWQPVANRLRAVGHQVYAPSLDGCGERKGQMRPGITTETQADEVAQLLFYEDLKDVVLVGTSYGGMVACRAAELMRERIGRLVFVDALTLFDGEKTGGSPETRGTGPLLRVCGGLSSPHQAPDPFAIGHGLRTHRASFHCGVGSISTASVQCSRRQARRRSTKGCRSPLFSARPGSSHPCRATRRRTL